MEIKSKYTGISYHKLTKMWRANFVHNKIKHEVGSYPSEKEAVKALDIYIIKNKIDRPLQLLKKK